MGVLQPATQRTDDLYLQGGKLYVALKNSDGTWDDYQYFGMTPSMTGTVNIETMEHTQTEEMPPSTDDSVVKKIDVSLSTAVDQISQGMIALFFLGQTRSETQASGSQSGTITGAKKGYSYDVGYRNFTSFSLTSSDGNTTYSEGSDYTVNKDTGLLTIVSGGTIADGSDLSWSGDVEAATYEIVEALTKEKIEAKLRFESDPIRGKRRIWTFHYVTISPSGDFAIKSAEEYAQASFDIKALADTTITGDGLSKFFKVESVA